VKRSIPDQKYQDLLGDPNQVRFGTMTRSDARVATDPAAVAELLAALVAIDSVNPDLVPGGAGEAEIAAFVAGWLTQAGLAVELDEPAPGRPSVIATARGRGGGRSLMLNAHLDTVGVEGMAAAHAPRIAGGRLYGRGAFDMKGSLAACMVAAAHAAGAGLAGDVILTAVSDEEYASVGTQSVLKRVRADACIVTEPTALRVCVAHKGFVWADVETHGRAAHGSRPELGVDAIAAMGPVLVGLGAEAARLAARTHPLLGPGSVHASLIAGGQELSSYPESCRLALERRTLPGETPEDVRAELAALLPAGATLKMGLARDPFEVALDEPVVRCLLAHAASPEPIGDPAWMDSALTSAAGIPTVVFGPAGAGAHAVEEWVDLESVVRCAEVLVTAARELCGAG
jgi:acetylornithine deacetylase